MRNFVFKPDDLEIQILKYVAQGLANKEIAVKVYVSSHTVKARLARIYRKLNCSGRAEAVHIATKIGLI